ncbi:MAG: hypothetical protein ACRCZ9_02840 [Fusobacteriaceae bacterium]
MILLTEELILTSNELDCLSRYPNYNIYKTEERGKSRTRMVNGKRRETAGKIIYVIEHKYKKHVPPVKRIMESLMLNDPLTMLTRSYDYLEDHKKLYQKYKYDVVNDGVLDNKILVKITHFDEELSHKVINVNTLRDMSDPFYHEYARLVNIRLAKERFPMYKMSIDYEKKGNRKETMCLVEHFDKNMDNKYAILGTLASGIDPFRNEYGVHRSLLQAQHLLPNYDIILLDKKINGKRVCGVQPKDKSMPQEEAVLNSLMYGANPFNKNGGGYDRFRGGYFYIHECSSIDGKVGLLYGISNYPCIRLSNHRNHNNKISTTTIPLTVFYNSDGNVARLCEAKIKSIFEGGFFKINECSTYTETLPLDDKDELIALLSKSEMVELTVDDVYVENGIKKERIKNMKCGKTTDVAKKGLGDL